mgnify:FL=1|jgi:hypothetical protein|tara:strand:+ start:6350 stop:6577 length:228 start_codon:yes stop_codon:yes gene_type:complete
MEIRKVSVGPDYKSGAMHYIVGQEVLNGNYIIHLIKHDNNSNSIKLWIINSDSEVILWKEFSSTMPVSMEYNINF